MRMMLGKTPLLHASRIGHLEVVLNLLKVGADVNIASQYANETTVYLAAEGGHEIVVSELISHHADVNIPNSHGVSPIYIASQSGHVKVVERLLAAGARLTPVDGITPLMVAAIRGNSNIVKILGNHSISELNQANKQGETALMLCTISRDFSCLQYLLDQGADCNLSDRKGYTVIMHAAIRSCVDMLEYLISHGCDMEAKDRAGLTALQLAQVKSSTLHFR
jgi:ankyrin repeat domain-containing protein 50